MSTYDKRRKILCLDFDGVIHGYQSGWKGANITPDPPVPGAMEFIDEAVANYQVVIFSSRSHQPGGIGAMQNWLLAHLSNFYAQRPGANEHDLESARTVVFDMIGWPVEKPPAHLSIDDRAHTFMGIWPTMEDIENFQPWNRR